MFLFSRTFSRTMEIHFSYVLGIVWISVLPKIFEKPITLECLCLPTLFPYYGNPLSHVLGTIWISASSEIFKRPINLKYLYFGIPFPYYGNPLFQCFEFLELYGFLLFVKYVWNTWPWNVLFSHTFPTLLKITFSTFWGR